MLSVGLFRFFILFLSQSIAGDWPRFRGPNGSGISDSTGLPIGFGPKENVIWKTAVPFARSSPIVAGNRLFLTGSEGDDLITMCFDSRDGRLLWERKIKRARAAEIYRQNDPASPTPVTDTNADKLIDAGEYDFMRMADVGGQGFAAIGLKGYGRSTEGKILWRYPKTYPSTTTPILYKGILYGVKDGGIIVALHPATGKVLKEGRTKEAMEPYYSSPVAADGVIYMVSESGKVSVIQAGPEWKVLKVIDLGEECYATPAIASGRIYIRTRNTLFCFGEWFVDQPAMQPVRQPLRY